MAQKEIMMRDIHEKVGELVSLTEQNERRKPGNRADHTVSVVTDGSRSLMVCGSAHQMTDLFVELLTKRPEFRQVLQDAVNRYGQTNTLKL